jgi:hypothetical protein
MLGALAAVANIAAMAALREITALADDAQRRAVANALRARAEIALAHRARAALLAQNMSVGGGDTSVAAFALSWPWHRVATTAGGAMVTSDLARALAPVLPWCAGAVNGGTSAAAPGTITLAPASACTGPVATVPAASIAQFDSALVAGTLLPPQADTVIVNAGDPSNRIWRARMYLEVGAGADIRGLLIAPAVVVRSGATARGIAIAASALTVESGAMIVGDEQGATSAIRDHSLIRLIGRRAILR